MAMRTVLAAIGVVLLATGCATTEVAQVKGTGSGFLGADYKLLTPGETSKGQAGLRYFNPSAQWRQYSKIMIEPVTFWGDDASKVPAEDQQRLSDYFNASLKKAFGEKFQIVDAPGPGVMKLQVAVVDAESSTPGLRTFSLVLPQARLLSAGASAVKGEQVFAGSLQVEAKMVDAVTGRTLAATVARAVGGSNVKAAAQVAWGDAENAMDYFSSVAATNLQALTAGTATPAQLPLK